MKPCFLFNILWLVGYTIWLSACNLVTYQPTETISQIEPQTGYRLSTAMEQALQKENLLIVTFSGGGSRAASLGYGVLEQFKNTPVRSTEKGDTLLDNIDVVYGVSGGAVLAGYFSLEGRDVIPKFNERFLNKNLQKELITQVFSLSNMPRLTSSQFGRSDLLQERLNLTLYKNKKFADLATQRKGPFAVISATDMTAGQKVNFTQDFFDMLCLNLNDLQIARAVAASSAVPLIFSPITLNNHGGNCHFYHPLRMTSQYQLSTLAQQNLMAMKTYVTRYQDTQSHPYLHLVDGGLTDNLGLAGLLDISNVMQLEELYAMLEQSQLRNIVVVNVNAQNEITTEMDKSADIPGITDVVNTVIRVPINKTSESTLQYSQKFTEQWNAYAKRHKGRKIQIYFVNLSLKQLPDGKLKNEVLNIGTSFYLPTSDVEKLRAAAKILLDQSKEYQAALKVLQEK